MGWVLHLHVLERGETLLLASSSSFFFSSSQRARLFAGLTRGKVILAKSLEPPSVDDSSTFLLAPLSDAFLHQHKAEALGTAPT